MGLGLCRCARKRPPCKNGKKGNREGDTAPRVTLATAPPGTLDTAPPVTLATALGLTLATALGLTLTLTLTGVPLTCNVPHFKVRSQPAISRGIGVEQPATSRGIGARTRVDERR